LETLNKELRQLRNLLKNMIDSMPSVLVGVDMAGRVIQWNRGAEEATGTSAQEAQGQLLSKVFPMLAGEMEKVHLAIRERSSQESTRIVRDAEGEQRFRDVTVYPLEVDDIEGAVIRVDDVTDRIRLEEMIIQSEKMLSVGGLAAGMAHEINNPLAGIMQNVQVLRNRFLDATQKNKQVAEECNTHMEGIKAYTEQRGQLQAMDHIMDSANRAAEIVENMLSFSRKSEFEFELHDLADIMENAIELATKKYNLQKKQDFRQIEIVREYQEGLPQIPCERTKIQQVLLNLLANGAEAMSDGTNENENPRLVVRLRLEKEMACIEVEDNGPGMPEKVKKRVFEPFYSTKGVGQGTGLGLSISYFIVVDHHRGTMEVESAPGKGTTFIIHLPLQR
jgi:PAS domain S-box-containing protein